MQWRDGTKDFLCVRPMTQGWNCLASCSVLRTQSWRQNISRQKMIPSLVSATGNIDCLLLRAAVSLLSTLVLLVQSVGFISGANKNLHSNRVIDQILMVCFWDKVRNVIKNIGPDWCNEGLNMFLMRCVVRPDTVLRSLLRRIPLSQLPPTVIAGWCGFIVPYPEHCLLLLSNTTLWSRAVLSPTILIDNCSGVPTHHQSTKLIDIQILAAEHCCWQSTIKSDFAALSSGPKHWIELKLKRHAVSHQRTREKWTKQSGWCLSAWQWGR